MLLEEKEMEMTTVQVRVVAVEAVVAHLKEERDELFSQVIALRVTVNELEKLQSQNSKLKIKYEDLQGKFDILHKDYMELQDENANLDEDRKKRLW